MSSSRIAPISSSRREPVRVSLDALIQADPVGFWDTMVIALPGGRSRFVWSEDLDLPLGLLGRLGWPIARPAFLTGVKRSLAEFARLVEAGRLPR